ncbi:hypothetical protein CTI12_AA629600 [Artemisia annua]|uniref:Uncharacterized protein n=1 Tax=Artemisia annua TaxID=35608 RepID=A0A2U1K9B0_ARTAN|nr:hypothetical protein CTI12_AA629600 [Artemisia annua]
MMSPSSPLSPQPSPWHSPVPYLFGGLAAMMGLIAFALLVLACSYWKISGHFDHQDRDIESGNVSNNTQISPPQNNNNEHELREKEEKLFVIMAGEEKPTFLATPSSSRTTSFGSCSWRSNLSALTEASLSSEEDKHENHEAANHVP